MPTESGEADGTFTWNQTTLVLVEAGAGSVTGLGFTYANRATAVLIHDSLRELVIGRGAMDVGGAYGRLPDGVDCAAILERALPI